MSRPPLTAEAEALFQTALVTILVNEGGYANNPHDPGGATNYGITQGTFDAWRSGEPPQPVRWITMDVVADIYRASYWRDGRCDAIAATHHGAALAVFDATVNCGLRPAAQQFQRALGVTDDGIIGSGTLAALEAQDDRTLTTAILEQRAAFYRRLVAHRPTSAEFLDGWLARLRRVARASGATITAAFAKAAA
jgi:lysozyme family protein